MTEIYVYQDANAMTVFGGPATVNVSTGFGETGQRGSLIYVFSSDPRSIALASLPDNLLTNDIAIVPTNISGNFDVYQKIAGTKQSWVQIVKSRTNVFRENVTFATGVATISKPISSLVSNTTGITVANFSVQLELEDTGSTDYPVAHTISTSVSGGNLIISIKAAYFNGTAWTSFTNETRLAHITISVL